MSPPVGVLAGHAYFAFTAVRSLALSRGADLDVNPQMLEVVLGGNANSYVSFRTCRGACGEG